MVLKSLKPLYQASPCSSKLDYRTRGPSPGLASPAGGSSRAVVLEEALQRPCQAQETSAVEVLASAARVEEARPGAPHSLLVAKDAIKDAMQRACQITTKVRGDAATTENNNTPDFGLGGQKRQLEDGDQPDSKKVASREDLIGSQLGPFHPPRRTSMTEEYRVPDGMVGSILSRDGEQINKIQQDSGCKVQISPDSGGLPQRRVSLTGARETVQKAKRMLDDIVTRGRRRRPGQFQDKANGGQNGTVQEIMIPAGKARLVIGKGGKTVKQLQKRAEVKMILIQDGSQNTNVDKPLRIIGDPSKVQQAHEMVMDILRERDQGGFGNLSEYGALAGRGIDVPVPRHSVGVVIGRSGEMIKKIQNDAGVRIQFKQDDGTGPQKIAHIMGPPDRCEHAARIINDLIVSLRGGPPGHPGAPGMRPGGPGPAEPMGTFNHGPFYQGSPGAPPHAGGPHPHQYLPQSWGNTYPQRQPPAPQDPNKAAATATDPNPAWAAYFFQYYHPIPGPMTGPVPAPTASPAQGEAPNPSPTGQSDYTKAWGEYYKKIGQQLQQPGVPPQQDYTKAWEEYYKKQAQVATGGGPGAPPGPQPDYSAAWTEYYRQQAAYYGQNPGPGGPQSPPIQQGQQQTSGNCLPPPLSFQTWPPSTLPQW